MTKSTPVYPPLTPSQCRVARLVALGYSTPQIMRALNLAEQTVKNYLGEIYAALGWTHDAGNQRVLLARYWIRMHGLDDRQKTDAAGDEAA